MILIGENLSQCHFADHKSQWTDLGSNPGLRGEKTYPVSVIVLWGGGGWEISPSVLCILQNTSMYFMGRSSIVFMLHVMIRAVAAALYKMCRVAFNKI
jgi:hypothetical protein